MIWHCGLIDNASPQTDDILREAGGGSRTKLGLTDEVRHEVAILLAMPGFSTSYLAHGLNTTWNTIARYRQVLPGIAELSSEVATNWLSVTRDDAIALCHRRPVLGDVPLICQTHMLDDIKSGRLHSDVARAFGVSREWLSRRCQSGLRCRSRNLPQGFELLTSRL